MAERRSDAAGASAGTPGKASDEPLGAEAPDGATDADGDDPVARIQTLFPGRIVAIEATEAAPGTNATDAEPGREADDGGAASSG